MWPLRALGLALASLILFSGIARGQSADELIERGDREHATYRPAAALVHYEAAVVADPTSAEALRKASRAAVDAGEQSSDAVLRDARYRTGEQYARRAIEASPNDPEAHFSLARALGLIALNVGVRDRVNYAVTIRDEALRALELDPNHPGALHVLGVWNAEVMRLSGLERFFARNLLGGQIFSTASWNDAVSYMERAVAIDPDRLTHHLDLGKIYADIGETEKARTQFEFVIKGRQTDVNDPMYKREAESALQKLK